MEFCQRIRPHQERQFPPHPFRTEDPQGIHRIGFPFPAVFHIRQVKPLLPRNGSLQHGTAVGKGSYILPGFISMRQHTYRHKQYLMCLSHTQDRPRQGKVSYVNRIKGASEDKRLFHKKGLLCFPPDKKTVLNGPVRFYQTRNKAPALPEYLQSHLPEDDFPGRRSASGAEPLRYY